MNKQEEPMELKVKLSLDDYRKWVFGLYYGGLRGKIMYIASAVFFACLILLIFLEKMSNKTVNGNLIVFGLVILFLLVSIPSMMYFRLKKYYETDKLVQEEITYVIDENGMKTSASYGGSKFDWDKIYGAHLRKTYITIDLGKGRSYLLPARCFRDAGQMQELADLLAKVLPKSRVNGKI
jgi:hypothetical protein